jgi:hypothetical protein
VARWVKAFSAGDTPSVAARVAEPKKAGATGRTECRKVNRESPAGFAQIVFNAEAGISDELSQAKPAVVVTTQHREQMRCSAKICFFSNPVNPEGCLPS